MAPIHVRVAVRRGKRRARGARRDDSRTRRRRTGDDGRVGHRRGDRRRTSARHGVGSKTREPRVASPRVRGDARATGRRSSGSVRAAARAGDGEARRRRRARRRRGTRTAENANAGIGTVHLGRIPGGRGRTKSTSARRRSRRFGAARAPADRLRVLCRVARRGANARRVRRTGRGRRRRIRSHQTRVESRDVRVRGDRVRDDGDARAARDDAFSPRRGVLRRVAHVGIVGAPSAARARRGGTRRWTRRTIPKFRVAPGVRVVRETSVSRTRGEGAVSKFGRRRRAETLGRVFPPGRVRGGIVGRRGGGASARRRVHIATLSRDRRARVASPGTRRGGRRRRRAQPHRRGVTEITQNETAAAGGSRRRRAANARRTHRVRRVGRPRDAKCVDAR